MMLAQARALVQQLHAEARTDRWHVSSDDWETALSASAAKVFPGEAPPLSELERYLKGLHLADLALAVACAAGDDEAWQYFVLTFRPVLYRAADAIAPGGHARETADGLYADLFGLGDAHGTRRSLFRYFHGRSSLATWLRSVLAQRYVDGLRTQRRVEPLPRTPDGEDTLPAPARGPDVDRGRFVALMHHVLVAALALLESRDRLRLACYYAQRMTLAQIGRLLGEHEATVSRHLTRTRGLIRHSVEQQLRTQHHLDDEELTECFRTVVADAGPLDLGVLLGADGGKNPSADRSSEGRST